MQDVRGQTGAEASRVTKKKVKTDKGISHVRSCQGNEGSTSRRKHETTVWHKSWKRRNTKRKREHVL